MWKNAKRRKGGGSIKGSAIYSKWVFMHFVRSTPKINMLCLVQVVCISLPSCCNNSLYILGFFFFMIWQWMNFCWTLYLHIHAKSMLEFSKKVKETLSIIMVCNTFFVFFFFSMELFSTFLHLIFCLFKCIYCSKCKMSKHLTIV